MQLLYVVFNEAIAIMERDAATGGLSTLQTLQIAIPAGSGRIMAANTDPSGCKRLYVSTEKELLSMAIDASTGGLSVVGRCSNPPVSDYANYVQADRTGRFLLSAYYTAGCAAVHRLSAEGHLDADSGTPTSLVELTQGAHCVKLSLDNKTAFFPQVAAINHVEGSRIHCFDFDDAAGVLTLRDVTVPPPLDDGGVYQPPASRFTDAQLPSNGGRRNRFNSRPELGPRHICVHPALADGSLYTSNEQGNSVSHWRPARSGGLELLTTVETVPEFYPESTQVDLSAGHNGSGCNAPSEIHMHPCGSTLYTTNRGHDTIACFALDPVTGTPAAGSRALVSHTPQSFRVDAAGRFLYAAGGPPRSGGERPGLDWQPDARDWGRITIFTTMVSKIVLRPHSIMQNDGEISLPTTSCRSGTTSKRSRRSTLTTR
eukprot:SAG31_NODE_4320_length_3361_cov_5.376150_2_plen_429_part_00